MVRLNVACSSPRGGARTSAITRPSPTPPSSAAPSRHRESAAQCKRGHFYLGCSELSLLDFRAGLCYKQKYGVATAGASNRSKSFKIECSLFWSRSPCRL